MAERTTFQAATRHIPGNVFSAGHWRTDLIVSYDGGAQLLQIIEGVMDREGIAAALRLLADKVGGDSDG